MSMRAFNVLFLCTGNSARSIMAEVLLNALGKGTFAAHSAGSRPAGRINPFALELLGKNRLPSEGLRSKSWSEFAQPGAPKMDFVFTVCDETVSEVCPIWPGQPMSAHWGIDDPALAEGSEGDRRKAFFKAYNELQNRLLIFVSLPLKKLDRHTLQRRLDEIGLLGASDGDAPTHLVDRIQSASRPLPLSLVRQSVNPPSQADADC